MVCVRVLRSASAWALPRPSAIASAKLAKSTVNQSQRAIWRPKPDGSLVRPEEERDGRDGSAPTSVTNMTGFFSSVARVQLSEGSERRPDR